MTDVVKDKSFMKSMQMKATAVLHALSDLTTDAVPDKPRPVTNKLVSEPSDILNKDTDSSDLCSRNVIPNSEVLEDEYDKIKNKSSKKSFFNGYGNKKKNKFKPDFNFKAQNNYIHIANSSNVHVGPTLEHKVYVSNQSTEHAKSTVKVTQEILDIRTNSTPVTTDHLLAVSPHIEYNWKKLAVNLGYSRGQIAGFEKSDCDMKEQIYQMLLDWIEDKTDEATLGLLCENLWSVDEQEAVERLARYVYKGTK